MSLKTFIADDADDFEDEVEPEPEPEHSSLVNMLYNNDGDGDDYFGYDEDAYWMWLA